MQRNAPLTLRDAAKSAAGFPRSSVGLEGSRKELSSLAAKLSSVAGEHNDERLVGRLQAVAETAERWSRPVTPAGRKQRT
jgi:hypothetical protein